MSALLLLAGAFPLALAAVAARPSAWWTPALGALPALGVALLMPVGTTLDLPWLLLGTRLGLDEIGRVFLLFTAFLWTVAGVTASAQLRWVPEASRFRLFFLLAMTGNLWLVLGQDLVSFYAGFALMGLASYGLVVQHGDRAALRAGKVYLVLTLVGELALFVALVAIASQAGGLLPERADLAGLDGVTVALLVLGFGIKAGLVPLHVWVPLAYPAAPIAAAVVLSGAMSKVALLGWLRFLPLGELAAPEWGIALALLGLATLLYALPVGLVQSEPRALLAYSSIGKAGLFVLILGIILIEPAAAPLGIAGLVIYAVHHALVKGGLFLGVGLRGWTDRQPRLQVWILVGISLLALAMAGAPLTSGALAKAGVKTTLAAPDWPWLDPLMALITLGGALLMLRFIESVRVQPKPPGSALGWAPSPSVIAAWTLLVLIVVILPFALGDPRVWATNALPVSIALLIALPVLLIARHAPRVLRPLRGIIPPGDLLVLTRPIRLATSSLAPRAGRAMERLGAETWRGLAAPLARLGRPSPDPERQLRAWPIAGVLWLLVLGVLTLLLVVSRPT